MIEALDHFSTDDRGSGVCTARFIGEKVRETEDYIILAHMTADIAAAEVVAEYHYVLKAVIRKIEIFESDQQR